ncbi:MAG: DUF1553 domain-containing protein [Mariniblastus sp.]|nr:DUF1553 domain-containing protein [Mariniblastus sp.]
MTDIIAISLKSAGKLMVRKYEASSFLNCFWRTALAVLQIAFAWSLLNANVVAQEDGDSGQKSFTAREIEFFENKVRPLLSQHCLQCHGANEKKIRGGLRLTSLEEMVSGGDSGPAIVPGHPEESLLISSVRYEDYEMPPKGKLKESEIDILVQWVKMGAPDSRKSRPIKESEPVSLEAGRNFWAFRPLKDSLPPATVDRNWPRSDIDRYLLARMESAGITPVEDASRESLLRRIYLAVIGLPPTIGQISSFINDDRSTAEILPGLVDELLASTHFGERWGRHWLDVARFAESSGGGRSLMFPEAWRFRDYVVDAYNQDKAFDQFILEQIAGDLLPHDSHQQKTEHLVATGLLALGPTNYEQQDKELLRMEVIDEQIDTVGRAFLGMTLGCARCHDHKFDPIPMSDYYAMAGIFGSTVSLVDGNVSSYVTRSLASAEEVKAANEYLTQVKELGKRLAKAKAKLAKLSKTKSVQNETDKKAVSADALQGIVLDETMAQLTGTWVESTSAAQFVNQYYLHDDNSSKGEKRAMFSPKFEAGGNYEVRISYSASGNRASNTVVTVDHQDGKSKFFVNQSKQPPINGLFYSLGTFRFEADNAASVTISNEGTDGHVIVDAVQFLKQVGDSGAKGKDLVTPPNKASSRRKPEVGGSTGEVTKSAEVVALEKQINKLDRSLKEIKKNPVRPVAVAMSVKDSPKPKDGHLHIRGSVRNLGPVIPRGFLSVCSDEPRPEFGRDESGRLQLAEWIASPDHPLTVRVYVNRVWRHLFGKGLVSTIDNFGFVGEKPSHPELLDFLALDFIDSGWSTKKLIKKIVLSHAFQLSVVVDPVAKEKDFENRLIWRANRRRVDAEVLRDSILFASGELDLTPGGRTIRKITQYDLGYKFDTVRRSVYVPAFRNSMLPLFEVFDFANPNLVTGDRNTSTLPTQALFLMNDPEVIRASTKMADRLLAMSKIDDVERVRIAYLSTIGRKPTPVEIQAVEEYLRQEIAEGNGGSAVSGDKIRQEAWARFCHALFASLDFRYVD